MLSPRTGNNRKPGVCQVRRGFSFAKAGTGIACLEVQTQEARRAGMLAAFEDLNASAEDLLGEDWEELLEDHLEKRWAEVVGPDGLPSIGGKKVGKIVAVHEVATGGFQSLPLGEESDGSQRLLQLLPVLYRLDQGGVCVIDELESAACIRCLRGRSSSSLDATTSAS